MARPKVHKWSQEVTEHSERRHTDRYRSAMSMLTFYINRAGAQLQPGDKLRLEKSQGRTARPGPPARVGQDDGAGKKGGEARPRQPGRAQRAARSREA